MSATELTDAQRDHLRDALHRYYVLGLRQERLGIPELTSAATIIGLELLCWKEPES